MLTLTENAQTIVRSIAEQPGNPESSGLRITSEGTPESTFAVTATANGEPGDQLVDEAGARVYLDPGSAQLLDDKILDATVDPDGRVEFALAQQA